MRHLLASALGLSLVAAIATPAPARTLRHRMARPHPVPVPRSVMASVDRAAGHRVVPGPEVEFETTKGDFVVVLFPKEAPKTVANFLKLTRKGFYNGLKFHRVIPGFVAQGGDPLGTGEGGPGYTIPDEHDTLEHITGALAMAKTSQPNSAGSQFYVTLAPTHFLDGKYTVFGQVISGMGVVERLQPTETPSGMPTGKQPDRMLKVFVL